MVRSGGCFDGICDCECHYAGAGREIAHCMACCYQCPYCGLNISTFAHDEHKKRCEPIHVLDIEIGYFNQHREEWFKHHVGKFALIKGVTVHNFYDSQENAYEAGCQLWGLVPFLIKEVQLEDKVIFMPDRVVIRVRDNDQDEHQDT